MSVADHYRKAVSPRTAADDRPKLDERAVFKAIGVLQKYGAEVKKHPNAHRFESGPEAAGLAKKLKGFLVSYKMGV